MNQRRICTLALPYPDWNPRWKTDTTRGLAAGIYDDKAFDRLPILADAIQDEADDHGWLLDFLRDERTPQIAFRGMWILDRLTRTEGVEQSANGRENR